MRALVTGANGFIGRHVVRCLLEKGVEVVGLGRSATSTLPGVRMISADLLYDEHLDEAVRSASADLLIHLAWYAEPGAYWTSPLNEEWVRATARLVEAFCSNGGNRVVGAGTCAEYDWSQGYCQEASKALRPATPYGVAKDAARRATVAACAAHGVPSAWVRIFIPIGPGESPQRLVPSVIAVLRGARDPFVIDGAASRDFLHVSDVAAGLVRVALADAVGEYNVCSGIPTRIADLIGHLARHLGADAASLERLFARREGEPLVLYGDCHRLQRLGWRSAFSIAEAIEDIASRASEAG
jgi:nucleoside-diphosphate-sugar epimerase